MKKKTLRAPLKVILSPLNDIPVKNDQMSILLNKRAMAKLELNLFKEAAEDATAALSINPKFGYAYWNRGIAYGRLSAFTAAKDEYTQAMLYYQNEPENLAILLSNRAWINGRLGIYPQAIEDYTKALTLDKGQTGIYSSRALAYSSNGDYQLAINDYTSDILYNNHDDVKEIANVYKLRGDNYTELEKYKEAINDYNAALKINPDLEGVYVARGDAYMYNGDYELSSLDYTSAMPFYQNNSRKLSKLYSDRSDNERDINQFNKSLEDVNKAISLNPASGSAYWSRGLLNTQIGECRLAIEDYTKAMELYKSSKNILALLHNGIASEYYVLKEDQKVIDECTTSIALAPDKSSPYFLLGKIYLKRQINKAEAMKNFQKAIELDTAKKSISYIFSQFYTGNTDLATQLLKQTILNTPNEHDALHYYYNIACVYSIMNQADLANIYLKKAVESGYPKKFVSNDEDFDNIRNTPEYIAIMKTQSSK
jgi:tetratricopeptide (TPR) repeat protein